MLNEFIEKILVHERDRKGSIQTTQEVEIYFNFVAGSFPAFGETGADPEELEEIRKREERKDRLHQNYLKRKASGAQKRYEDKIKKRKKAEIEAKKAPFVRRTLQRNVRPCQQFTAERADERSTNSMNITYTQNGDYLIPNIVIRKTKPLGHCGRLRKAYLKCTARYCSMNWYYPTSSLSIAEIGKRHNRMELIVRSCGKAVRRDRTAESRKPNGMGAADERLQGTGE